jgi:hypothetical protein
MPPSRRFLSHMTDQADITPLAPTFEELAYR